jgi:hypothetical protein
MTTGRLGPGSGPTSWGCTVLRSDSDRFWNLAEAARHLGAGRNGRPIHPATLTRWILDGVRLRDGGRLRLRAARLPAGWRTTASWLDEFIAALTADRAGGPAGEPMPTPARRRRDHERAERELRRAGF